MITYTLDEKSRKRLVLCTLGEEDFPSSLSLPNSEHGSERRSPFCSSGQTGTGEEEFFLTSSMESDTASEMCRVMSLLTGIGKASWELLVNFSSHGSETWWWEETWEVVVKSTFPGSEKAFSIWSQSGLLDTEAGPVKRRGWYEDTVLWETRNDLHSLKKVVLKFSKH